MDDDDRGREHLTAELRRHFERMGASVVEFDVVHHRYGTPAKHQAALYWLREQRQRRETREATRFGWVMIVASLTLLATLGGIAITVWLSK